MTEFNTLILSLQEKITRKLQLEDRLPQLQEQLDRLRPNILTLERIKQAEQQDVDRLESGGIGAVVHKLMGTMDEKLNKERQEAQSAADTYQAALLELEDLEQQLAQVQAELEKLMDCPQQYQQAMQTRIRELETRAAENGENTQLLGKLLQLERTRRSLREALLNAQLALNAAEKNLSALECLRDACDEDDPAVREHLAKATVQAEVLQEKFTSLQAKLAQLGIDPQPHLSLCDYLKAPAIYIQSITSDFSQSERIDQAMDQIHQLQNQLHAVTEKLTQALAAIEEKIEKAENNLVTL